MTNDEQKRVEEIRELTEVYCLCNAAQALRELPFLLDIVKRQEEENACLTAALAKEEKRAEAAIKMLKQSNPCNHCTHFADDKYCNYCDDQCSNFKWLDPTEQEERQA